MSENRFILCQDDLGNYEIWDDDKVFHFLWEVAPILNEQESTIIKQDGEIKKLKRTERSWRRIHCCNKESDNCGIVIEQQATIQSLKEENEQLKSDIMLIEKNADRHYEENKQLKKELNEYRQVIIDKVQYYEDNLEDFLIKKGVIKEDWARFDDYD